MFGLEEIQTFLNMPRMTHDGDIGQPQETLGGDLGNFQAVKSAGVHFYDESPIVLRKILPSTDGALGQSETRPTLI